MVEKRAKRLPPQFIFQRLVMVAIVVGGDGDASTGAECAVVVMTTTKLKM